MLLALWSGFWDWGSEVTPVIDTHDGGSNYNSQDIERYKKFLKTLERLDAKKTITPAIVEAAKEVLELPVSTPEIAKIAINNDVAINYDFVALEMIKVQNYIDKLIAYNLALDMAREQDDELAILLLIN